jgi:hypothetical protein
MGLEARLPNRMMLRYAPGIHQRERVIKVFLEGQRGDPDEWLQWL